MTTPSPLPPTVAVWKLWLVALILAACETWINFDASPGLNWPLSALATSLAFAFFRSAAGKPLRGYRLWALALGCILAGGAAVTANAQLAWLALVGAVSAIAVGLRMDSHPKGSNQLGARVLLLAPATTSREVLGEARSRFAEASHAARSDRGAAVLRGVAFAIPITAGFALLLSNADPQLAYWRGALLRALVEFSLVSRVLFFAGFGALSLGALGGALNPCFAEVAEEEPTPTGHWNLGPTEGVIILGAVASLFGLFFVLQISHFFGNAAGVAGSGITYAEAAHQGFGELTIAASLCGALLMKLAARSNAGVRHPAECALSAALVLEAQVLLLSANYRLELYENVYGFTELRLYVQCYTAVVFVALGQLGLEVIGSPDFRRLAGHWAVTVLLALTGLVYWNHAAWIARSNFERYETRNTLDLGYLVLSLGPDAVPEIIHFLPRLPAAMQSDIRACLRSRYPERPPEFERHPWYEWNYRRAQLVLALATQPAPLGAEQPSSQSPSSSPCALQ